MGCFSLDHGRFIEELNFSIIKNVYVQNLPLTDYDALFLVLSVVMRRKVTLEK